MPQATGHVAENDFVVSRRWNGWGDERVSLHLPKPALAYLRERLGASPAPSDASFASVATGVPPSRLPQHPLVDTSAGVRALHARAQSFADWLALRFGRIQSFPDGVAFPESAADVRELLRFARDAGCAVVPYGGGTSVAGHITPASGDRPTLTVSLARMRALLALEPRSRLATFQAGVAGPDLEAQLRPHGFTLGHFPQSFEYSTLGGWIVTRSSGQQSLHYGRIERLFAGGVVETPAGTLRVATFPATAAGLDVREMILGSEGRLGIVTEATVRVSPVPQHETFAGIFFPSWQSARDCAVAAVQAEIPLSMIRVANPIETFTTLRLAGGSAVAVLERFLGLRGVRDGKCLTIVAASGDRRGVGGAIAAYRRLARHHGGIFVGTRLGDRWRANRFRGVYLRNALWERGYGVDTLETAIDWPGVDAMMEAIESSARAAFGSRPVHGYSHLSHVYAEGSSVYSTFVFPLAPSYEENFAVWSAFKARVSEAIVAHGGTITHQHGIGLDHKPYLEAEKGALGLDAMRALFARFDPDGLMNPGKLC